MIVKKIYYDEWGDLNFATKETPDDVLILHAVYASTNQARFHPNDWLCVFRHASNARAFVAIKKAAS